MIKKDMKIRQKSFLHSPPPWVRDAIFYEIFPDRFFRGNPSDLQKGIVPWNSPPTRENFFGGDLKGIIAKLPYLEELGVNALYLTPIFKATKNHRYDTSDYMEVDPGLGTQEILRDLISEAHNRGIRIILDVAFNHSGFEFWAFQDIRKNGPSSRYANWYTIQSYPIQTDPVNYQTCSGVWNLPKFNITNPEVREYLLKVARFWIQKFGIDGYRLDTPYKMPLDFWRAFRETVKKANPDAYIVAEVWRYPHLWVAGDTADGIMNYLLRDHVLVYLDKDHWMDGEDFDFENHALRSIFGPRAPYQMNLLGSHDTPRILTLTDNDVDRVILAISFLFTYIGAPMIYYGDEIGLCGNGDPDCRRTMNWDESTWEPRIWGAYKQLIHTRREHTALRSDNFETLYRFDGVYAYRRKDETDEVIVILNSQRGYKNVRIPLGSDKSQKRIWQNLMTKTIYHEADGFLQIDEVPSKSALILFPNKLQGV